MRFCFLKRMLLLSVCFVHAQALAAQAQELQPLYTQGQLPPPQIQLQTQIQSQAQSYVMPPSVLFPGTEGRRFNADGELELRRFKKQALQSVSVGGGVLAGFDSDGVDSTFAEFSIGSGIPLGSFDNILGVKPAVRIDWIEAAADIDIPSELYQFEMQFFYRRPIRENLSLIAIVSPSIRSDLTTDDNAFRFFGLGLLNWECIPDRLTLSGGAVSLGRADLPVLPALGLSWTPSARTKLDLQFPRSRLSYRLEKDGGDSEIWSYMTVGIGGNTWAVTRQSGLTDELSLGDYRITFGLQRLVDGGGNCFLETGAAFGRELEYEGDNSVLHLGNAFILQGGWSY